MATISSHVLDSIAGTHASGVRVECYRLHDSGTRSRIFDVQAGSDGRIKESVQPEPASSSLEVELIFHSNDYFASQNQPAVDVHQIMTTVIVRLSLPDPDAAYHVPLMLSPHSYSLWWSSIDKPAAVSMSSDSNTQGPIITEAPHAKLAVSRRLRSTPYTPRVEALGVSDYSIVNHMVLPKGFGRTVEQDYWHLREHVQLWDVSCQRQVEITGPDAAQLVQLMTPRDLRAAQPGQCLYAPLIDQHAGMLNDPVILKLADNHFWLSIADADVLLWAEGLALGFGLNVRIKEPDVSPLAVQGPKAEALMARVFGDVVRSIRFFRFLRLPFHGHQLVVARAGYSKQGGFEIYLDDSKLGLSLWDSLWSAGEDLNVLPGSPNLIERVEAGLLSFGNEFNRENNPLECAMGQYCSFDPNLNYIGKDALATLHNEGPQRLIRGVLFDGEKCPPCANAWPLEVDKVPVGQITTAIWSPRLKCNIALGMLDKGYWNVGQAVTVVCADGGVRKGSVSELPIP